MTRLSVSLGSTLCVLLAATSVYAVESSAPAPPEEIRLNLDDTQVETVAGLFETLTGKRHIVEGSGTVRFDLMESEFIPVADAHRRFLSVVTQLGCEVVEEDDTIRIIKPGATRGPN